MGSIRAEEGQTVTVYSDQTELVRISYNEKTKHNSKTNNTETFSVWETRKPSLSLLMTI